MVDLVSYLMLPAYQGPSRLEYYASSAVRPNAMLTHFFDAHHPSISPRVPVHHTPPAVLELRHRSLSQAAVSPPVDLTSGCFCQRLETELQLLESSRLHGRSGFGDGEYASSVAGGLPVSVSAGADCDTDVCSGSRHISYAAAVGWRHSRRQLLGGTLERRCGRGAQRSSSCWPRKRRGTRQTLERQEYRQLECSKKLCRLFKILELKWAAHEAGSSW